MRNTTGRYPKFNPICTHSKPIVIPLTQGGGIQAWN